MVSTLNSSSNCRPQQRARNRRFLIAAYRAPRTVSIAPPPPKSAPSVAPESDIAPYLTQSKYCIPYRMQYEDRSASGYARRKAQKAIASTYAPSDPPKSLDSSVLTALRQGQQTIVRTPITTVCDASGFIPRDDPGCCCSYPPLENLQITLVATNCPVMATITWADDPNAISYDVAVQVITGSIDPNNPPLFETPGRTSVIGELSAPIQTFKIGIIAIYPCGTITTWSGVQTLPACA